jgi:type II secretory pathway pseudopilin PulG
MKPDSLPGQTLHGRRCRCAGFTYLALLVALGLMALSSAVTTQLGTRFSRAMAEEELIETGMAYRAALISYARATPVGMRRRPARLEDLLQDPRYPSTRRHLRKLYADPITGQASWGLVQASDGSGIIGVHSLSDERIAVKRVLSQQVTGQDQAETYRDWKFLSTQ